MYAGLTIADKPALEDAQARGAEMEREQKPLTWNERINQMTLDERAKHSAVYALVVERARRYAYRTRRNRAWEIESVMDRYMRKFLASPYTEGETT